MVSVAAATGVVRVLSSTDLLQDFLYMTMSRITATSTLVHSKHLINTS